MVIEPNRSLVHTTTMDDTMGFEWRLSISPMVVSGWWWYKGIDRVK